MVDSFVLLAPAYVLAVIALLGFVGCNQVYGLDETMPKQPPPAPTNLVATPGDADVRLAWDAVSDATEFHVFRGTMSGSVAADYPDKTIVALTDLPYTDDTVTNGTTYFYRVAAVNSAGEGALSDEEDAMPTWPFGAFVTSVQATTPRPGENGFFGMEIQVGQIALTIQTLGRSFTPALSGMHEVRLVEVVGVTTTELGHAVVDVNSPAEGNFKYAPLLPSPVTVAPGGIYYIVSQEFTGGDQFFDQNTLVQTRLEAKVNRAIYSNSPGLYVPVGGMSQSYGPVSFQY
jgi:hypothetical protein